MNTSTLRAARALILCAGIAALAACGGGGGGGVANQPPTAAAAVSGEAVLQATTVFDTSASRDADGTIASHSWDYGDGTHGVADTHVYTSTGTFQAQLTVTDNAGATGQVTVPVTVARCSSGGLQASTLSPWQTVCIQTTRGEMVVELFTTDAPVTTGNFLRYVDDGFYAGTLFAPVTNLRIDAGGYTSGPVAKAATHPAIALENQNGLKNWQYTVAMDRGALPDSATSRFYVNLVDNHQLDFNPAVPGPNGNAVFGQLISGTTTAEAIGAAPAAAAGAVANVPTTDIVIRSALRLK